MAPIKNIIFALIVAADLIAAHSVITNAVGDAGGSGMALGVDTSTPRDGTRRRPFQTDATRFRGSAADTVGETLAGGDNQIEQGTLDIMEETGSQLPQVNPGGSLEMTVHQVNSDGAGPYACMINADGTGTSWDNIPVTTNVEGNERGRNRDGEMGDFPLVASIPAGQSCTGSVAGEENVCLVRCQNPARAGPFGGVIPVQMAQATDNNNNAGTGNTGNAAGTDNAGNAGDAGNTGNGASNGNADEEEEDTQDQNDTNTNTNTNTNTDTNNRNKRRATQFSA
ncbi:probable gEgh 16 protein [Fusarium mangiferae]|uniref:Probable gEgh 16 protein n=1 Tax=Fusarium mangiferae TaxID=192010 RepID=A0A1L7SF11_FUSMA|nr:putative gEgh 16 protein [Fusarium mangiferae]CVK85121.1 probable gEgh 16 protein [Fusarium mangiferae]